MNTTDFHKITTTKLQRITWLSRRDSEKEFRCLMHHFNEESLRECFNMLDANRAVGTDGISKAIYGQKLIPNIKELVQSMKQMSYQPKAVRQVLIPKAGKSNATRPLGISNFEDKLAQKMMQRVLESIYEPLFLECSYGFRPGIGCHDAIRALRHHLYVSPVETVIDVDIANFFGSIDHFELEEVLSMKIKDKRFMRYIKRMFKAGVLADGELIISDEGVMQGSCCSPVIANIFAHHVIDQWFETMVKTHCKGKVKLFRYCDDLCICCEYDSDAQRIKTALAKRLSKFKLKMNEDKTKLVEFSKNSNKPASFDFLGFTFYWGKSRDGYKIPKVKTSGKRLRAKLSNATQWIKEVRNKYRLKIIWKKLCIKIEGHIRYYGVSFNAKQLRLFIEETTKILFKWLNRRSQRKSFDWERFQLFIKANPLPKARICHKLF